VPGNRQKNIRRTIMGKKLDIKRAEFQSGLFIIITLALLIFSVLWLRYFALMPDKKITVRFNDPGPIETGTTVYYRGVNIGKVPKIELSEDYKYTLVHIDIYKKNLCIPSNSIAKIRSAGMTGQRYINIMPPEESSGKFIASGDVLEGKDAFDFNNFNDFIEDQIESGKFDKMASDFRQMLANTSKMSIAIEKLSTAGLELVNGNKKELNGLIKETSRAAKDMQGVLASVNEIVNDPEIKVSAKETIKGMNVLVNSTQKNTDNVFQQIGQSELIPNMSCAFKKTGNALDGVDNIISELGGKEGDRNLIKETLENTNLAARRVDCFSKNMGETMNQRFLLFKLMFGRPGASFEECVNMGQTCGAAAPK
jgi:hypothetical protein